MRARKLLVVAAITVVATGVISGTASAAPTDTGVVTFDVDAGTLDITVPATADLGGGTAGLPLSGELGPAIVDDGRASADASWETTVTTTDFTTGAGVPSETVPAAVVDYWSGPATATTGDGTFTPGQADPAAAAALDNVDPLTAFTHAGGTGNNTASWNPTLVVNIPLANVAGVYTGTVTHSVA